MLVDCAFEPRNVVACSVGRSKIEEAHLLEAQMGGNQVFNDHIFATAFGNKTLGNPIMGTRSNVGNLSAQVIQKFQLANFTNDSWWGRSLASRQHLQKSQMRAIEAGRSMLRATNTGVTAVIDHRGQVSHVAPEFETTVVNAQVWGRAGTTPFVRWGNYAFLTLSLAMIVSAALLGRFGKR